MPINDLPWETLSMFSETALQSFVLARENEASNLRRAIRAELERLARVTAELEIAHTFLHRRAELSEMIEILNVKQERFLFGPPE